MNFFEHQEKARKQTGRLLGLFVAALVGLIFLTASLFACFSYAFGLYNGRFESAQTGQPLWDIAARVFDWQFLGSITLAILAVVALAALFRMAQLKSGGRVIAEQMAIASGMPAPAVYVIDEPGINAFAAGYQPTDAVIGVTQGAIEQLHRSELQGVIAHEFSHIHNGDIRLNIRLIGMIYGIMVIAIVGRYFLQGSHYSRRDRGANLGIGLALLLLGYLGVFFANLIKSAICRQREFLADASAVQFTRSKEGIAGAFKKK